ncbi:hypothetical protein H3V53_42315 [Paraburkholderia bengalensis]|uniref:Transposase n=1 Tax=Paraburkholderia bengalensis TaxID=2747562 RepID=A0ABU8J6U5_9BURK
MLTLVGVGRNSRHMHVQLRTARQTDTRKGRQFKLFAQQAKLDLTCAPSVLRDLHSGRRNGAQKQVPMALAKVGACCQTPTEQSHANFSYTTGK